MGLRAALLLLLVPSASPLRESAPPSLTTVDKLGLSLHDHLARTAGAVTAKEWTETAELLRDSCCELAAASASAEGSSTLLHSRAPHACARRIAESLVASTSEDHPELHAVAKLSIKRNGNLATSARACERCLAELGVLMGTYAVLSPTERARLLSAARPISQTTPTGARLRSLIVLCRGFHTPGFGSGPHGWRIGKGTCQQLLAARTDSTTPCTADTALETALRSAPESLRRHSRLLRSSLPLLQTPLWLWLEGCDAQDSAWPAHTLALGRRLAALETALDHAVDASKYGKGDSAAAKYGKGDSAVDGGAGAAAKASGDGDERGGSERGGGGGGGGGGERGSESERSGGSRVGSSGGSRVCSSGGSSVGSSGGGSGGTSGGTSGELGGDIARHGASALLWLLVCEAGDEGARVGQAIARWAVDALVEALEFPEGTSDAPSSMIAADDL